MPARHVSAQELTALFERAVDGDAAAWDALVRATSAAVYRVLTALNVPPDVRDELYQQTYIRLVERISTIEKPAALPKWLMTTARNEAYGYFKARKRLVPVADPPVEAFIHELDDALLDSELKVAVARAFRRLSEPCQTLLRLCTVTPPLRYAEIAELLDRPIGDIGPQRMRCLARLRKAPELIPFLDRVGG